MFQPGHRLKGRYRIEKPIGKGGQARVYEAKDESTGRAVAIKELVPRGTTPGEREEEVLSFTRACGILGKLRHRSLPRHIDSFRESERLIVVEELIEGKTLQDVLGESGGKLPERKTLRIFSQVLHALAYLHSLSTPVLVRDIKPSNIMMTPTGRAYLIDFSAATHHMAAESTSPGTAGYAAPEQYLGVSGPQSDLYSVAAAMLQSLTGRVPSRGASLAETMKRLDSKASRQWERFFRKALDPIAHARFTSAKAMQKGLGPVRARLQGPWRVLVHLALLSVSLLLAYFAFISGSRVDLAKNCGKNLKSIVAAVDKYEQTHGGRCPRSLTDLVPDCLKALPTCPASGLITYSYSSSTPREFRVECTTRYHGKDALRPAYDTARGFHRD